MKACKTREKKRCQATAIKDLTIENREETITTTKKVQRTTETDPNVRH